MVVVDLAGNHVEGFRKPSIEVPMHTAIYRARPDVSAIIPSARLALVSIQL